MNSFTLTMARVIFMGGILIGIYGWFFRWHDPATVTELCVIAIGIKVLFGRRRFATRVERQRQDWRSQRLARYEANPPGKN